MAARDEEMGHTQGEGPLAKEEIVDMKDLFDPALYDTPFGVTLQHLTDIQLSVVDHVFTNIIPD